MRKKIVISLTAILLLGGFLYVFAGVVQGVRVWFGEVGHVNLVDSCARLGRG